jgi:pimeloyl-ACP methyl ester carboxylesterase
MAVVKTSANVSINYEIYGQGPPLLLISGTGHDLTFWSGQLDRFSAAFTCIVLDNRGVGESSKPDPGYSLAEMADDAAAVLAAAGVDVAHVMGFSMGGHIAQELALNHPTMVGSLGIHHSWATPCPRLAAFQSTRKALALTGMREELADVSLLCLFAQDYFQDHLDDMTARRRAMIAGMDDLSGWAGQLEACINGDTADRVMNISVPTLITASDKDMIVAVHRAEQLRNAISGARLEIMTGTGHVALIERPQEFADICFEFLVRQIV